MIEHVDELNATDFSIGSAAKTPPWRVRLSALREAGGRIKERLQDIVNEYDVYIRECTHIMDTMTLATQLELSRDVMIGQEISLINLDVAKMARRDGSLMRSIATLGMVFLPATFVSTFFSMGFFQWGEGEAKEGQILSPYFWIYVVVTVALTIPIILIFYFCSLKQSKNDDELTEEVV
ncbi:hypothetical protein NM208_g15252 [Fusarium decemcellulare]|uniref:Uncharacterized protein n=1 Tax=Fusarium decemcellulare TaxID=57161 RepID=A0ACC1RDP3_9HYPO|nr:hypothetical protein NM208_g15252 [Fusarium decemcellulare]